MSLICVLLFLLAFTASAFKNCTKDDEIALLKIKKQLGNPGTLQKWVKGYNFCGDETRNPLVIPDCDRSTGRVTSLIIENLDVVARFPDAICDLPKLQILLLRRTHGIYGPIPSCITKLSNLTFIGAVRTSISGPVPDFHNNTKLMMIILTHNQLSGTIPPSLSTLPRLVNLDLSFNHLTGSVPSGIIHVPYSKLWLSKHNLTSELPKCYGRDIFNTFLIHQTNIFHVNLTNNKLNFDLSYVEFPYFLYQLDLSHNNIYGKVPDSLANSPNLDVINLSFNKLCGELPQGGNMWRFKAEDFANNKCLCGSPLSPCFNIAPAPAAICTALL